MRLICPNCGAQYEVDDKVIPDAGRDVQCSNCGHTWFQRPAHLDSDLAEELGQEVDEDPATGPGAAKPRRNLDPDTANILREEAARETEARRAESAGLETQPDLGLDEDSDAAAAAKSAAARARMARLRGAEDSGEAVATPGSRRDLLPDIEEINSTLRASGDRADAGTQGAANAPEDKAKPSRRGFRMGFGLSVIVISVGALVYRFAPQIIQAVPQSEPFLTAYVNWANTMRGHVNGGVATGMQWVTDKIAGFTGGS